MTEISTKQINALFVAINVTLDKLTSDEIAGLGLCLLLENDPRQLPAWNKMEPLFDARDADGRPVMHDLSKKVFFGIYNDKFNIGEQS